MSEGFDFPAFRASAAEAAGQILGADCSSMGQAEAAGAVQRLAESTLEEHQQDKSHIACRAGCGHCCQINVAVLSAEAEAIISSLQQRLSPPEIIILQEKARQLHLRVGGLSDEDRLLARASCLFLDHWGNCSVYYSRPLLCRSITSTSPEACRDAITMAALGEEAPITTHLFQQELFMQAFYGLAEALETNRVEHRSTQLTEAVWTRLAAN